MKFYKLDNWHSSFRHDGLLYFTQRIQEMLFYYSSHIYKAPVLNTHLLIQEYLHTATLVKNKTINEHHLKYIMDEFQDTFSNDPIIRENVTEDRRKDILQRLNSASQIEQERIMRYLLHTLGDYNQWCINYLKEVVPQEKEKKKIERGLRSLIPGLIGAGYSHEFIFYFNRFVFSDSKVSSLDSLSIFLDRFDFTPRKYSVYLAIDKQALQFKEILMRHLDVVFTIDIDNSDLKYDKELFEVVKLEIKALDERKAASEAYDLLSLFFRYYNFIGDQKSEWLFNTGKVIDSNGQVSFVSLRAIGFDVANKIEEETAGEISAAVISTLLANARHSFLSIDRAVNMHNVAIAETDLRNGFLNLWSVFEILFVTDQTDSKIAEIEKKVLPVLQRDYLHLLVSELEDAISNNVSQHGLNDVLGNITTGDESQKFLHLLFLPQYSTSRKDVYKLLENHPLLRSRMSQIANDFPDRKNILADVERFGKRISWHFKRLYRTRNSIIHAGDNPYNLKALGEHLHSYVDECMMEIITLLVANQDLSTIDNVIIDIQLRETDTMRCLQQKEKLDEKAISFLFSGV